MKILPKNIFSSKSHWPNISSENKPWTRWWWFGGALDKVNLSRELEDLKNCGIGGVEPTFIYGVKGEEKRNIPFLSEEWLSMLAFTCQETKRLGMSIDLPNGAGWRCGKSDIDDKFKEKTFNLKKNVKNDGIKTYTIESILTNSKVKRAAPGGKGNVIDVLDQKAVELYIREYLEKIFSVLPHGAIRALFHDSWEYNTNWSRCFLEEFKKRRGYALTDHLYIFDSDYQVDIDKHKRIGCDYRLTINEMLIDNFSTQCRLISKKYKMIFRNQAHGSPGNILDIYADADIPETEIFGDNVNPFINKFASSAGNVTGKKLISAESFTWLSEHWHSDLGKIKKYTDFLFICGINHIFYHGTAYTPENTEWPGWLFYASTQFNNRNPLWNDWLSVNEYIARVQSFLQSGRSNNDVLIYWPFVDICMEGYQLKKLEIKGDFFNEHKNMKIASQSLWNAGYLFDYISDKQLEQVTASNGEIKLKGVVYQAIVIPSLHYIPIETIMKLVKLTNKGVKILCGNNCKKWDIPDFLNFDDKRKKTNKLLTKLDKNENCVLSNNIVNSLKQIVKPEAWQGDLRCVRRKYKNGDIIYFIVNQGERSFDDYIDINIKKKHNIFLNPWSTKVGIPQIDKYKRIRLQLEANESVLLKESDNILDIQDLWEYFNFDKTNSIEITGEWKVSFPIGGPVRPGSIKINKLISITELGIENLNRFAGTIRYETMFEIRHKETISAILLEKVLHSSKIWINDHLLGTTIISPHRLIIPKGILKTRNNQLKIEATTLAVNRIRDLDIRKVNWKKFDEINFVNINYQKFDAGKWPIQHQGLIGSVKLLSTLNKKEEY